MKYVHKPTEFKHYPAVSEKGESRLTIAVGPVIIEDGKVLLDKHGEDKYWKFPGGKYVDNSNFPDNARREAKEELGIEIRIMGEPFIYQFERNHEGVQEYVVLVHFHAKRIIIGKIKPGRDVREYEWFSLNKLPKDCAKNIRPAVRHFKKMLKAK